MQIPTKYKTAPVCAEDYTNRGSPHIVGYIYLKVAGVILILPDNRFVFRMNTVLHLATKDCEAKSLTSCSF